MSFPVAVQSAVFYFVACTPCAKVRHRHKTRTQAKKERLEKAKLETEQPGLYRHPSPFNTNPYWQEEINMGPSLSASKKSGSKNSSQRGLASSGRDSEAPSVSEHTNAGDVRPHFGDSTTAVPDSDGYSQDWNRQKGYQREDEELWGQWSGHKLMDAFSKARDSAGRMIESKLGLDKEVTDEDRRDFYFSPKNPPINEYHPPVVSTKVPRREAHQWMLQPPPPAKVMEGKVPVGRAVSTGSKSSRRTTGGSEVHLGRLVHERLARERARKQQSSPNPTESELIESLFITRSSQSLNISRSRSLSLDGAEEVFEVPFGNRRRSRIRSVATPPGEDSDDESGFPSVVLTKPRNASATFPTTANHAAQRPKLETIASTESENSSRAPSRLSRRQKSTKMKPIPSATSPVGDDTD